MKTRNRTTKHLGHKSKKALSYMRRMISNGTWKSNTKIPTLAKIADALDMSVSSVRKGLSVLLYDKTIQNYGSLGFFVLSDVLTQHYKYNRTSFLIHMSSVNLSLSRLAYFKRRLYGPYGIGINPNTKEIYAHNIITNKSLITSWAELTEIINNSVTVEKILVASEKEFPLLRKVYRRQRKLSQLAHIVNLNKKGLGLIND